VPVTSASEIRTSIEYVGIGLGAGANVLLGGSNRTVALQPISLQGSIALNVVAGVSSLKLRPLPM